MDQPIDDSAVDPSSTQAAEQDLTASGDRTEGMDPEHDVLVAAEEAPKSHGSGVSGRGAALAGGVRRC